MSSVKKIIQNPMHKEIEAIKDRLGKELLTLPWSEYKKKLDERIHTYLTDGGYYFEPTNRPGVSVIRKIS